MSETVCGRHLCFKDQEHARFWAKTRTRCQSDADDTCFDNNPQHELCTQQKARENELSPQYSYSECLEQCNDKIPGCYGFNYNPDSKTCHHLVLPKGETSRCTITTVPGQNTYMTATCYDCPPNNSRRIGCGGERAGTCPGSQLHGGTRATR